MRRRARRGVEIFNLSFLDVVSCGFGAIILVLVLVRVSEPGVIARDTLDLSGRVGELGRELEAVRGAAAGVAEELRAQGEALAARRARLAELRARLTALMGRRAGGRREEQAQEVIQGRLASARQDLSEEMRRLLGAGYRRPESDATIGGVPVDSEYVIFIIDTSGSMQHNAWPMVLKKIEEVLRIYPAVKGIQVMNDMGDYLFSQYRGRWIPDTPARRRAILRRLATWTPFSNSSPVEGIEAAIRRFHSGDRRISLYVFGDDFSRGSIQAVIDTVGHLNRAGSSGERRVRIHAVGFPVLFAPGEPSAHVVRFAALMRKLAEDNGGSFVGLNALR